MITDAIETLDLKMKVKDRKVEKKKEKLASYKVKSINRLKIIPIHAISRLYHPKRHGNKE